MTSDAGMAPGRELAGSVALITGAGRNIGRAIALSLAAGGAADLRGLTAAART